MQTSSNQLDIHKNLNQIVKKYISSEYKKPIAKHNENEFKNILDHVKGSKFIIDTGCGTGLSTEHLAKQYPEYHILGLDKSCLLYTSPSPRDQRGSRMPSSA